MCMYTHINEPGPSLIIITTLRSVIEHVSISDYTLAMLLVPLVLALVLLCGMRSIYMIQYFFASTSKWLHYMCCPTTTLQPLTLIINFTVNIGIYDQITTEAYVIIALNTLQIYHWVAEHGSLVRTINRVAGGTLLIFLKDTSLPIEIIDYSHPGHGNGHGNRASFQTPQQSAA